jgi:hypothetical protein
MFETEHFSIPPTQKNRINQKTKAPHAGFEVPSWTTVQFRIKKETNPILIIRFAEPKDT